MKKIKKHLVIPDVQAKPGVPLDHCRWAGEYAARKRPDVIVVIGDWWDMPSLSSFDKGKKKFEGRRIKADINAGIRAMEMFATPIAKAAQYNPTMVFTEGNHERRIYRAVNDAPELEGFLSVNDLKLVEFGFKVIPFRKPVLLDGVAYSHYFASGPKGYAIGKAKTIINTYHTSAFAGHLQGRDIAYAKQADGRPITAIIAGSFYQHSEAEDEGGYLDPLSDKHWRGVYMLHEVENGSFDEMAVSLDYLKRKFG